MTMRDTAKELWLGMYVVVGILLWMINTHAWRDVGRPIANQNAREKWRYGLLLYCTMAFVIDVLAHVLVLSEKSWTVRGRKIARLPIAGLAALGSAVRTLVVVVVMLWAVSYGPVEKDMNQEYCAWRARDVCFGTASSQNATSSPLVTYELLFPVTRQALMAAAPGGLSATHLWQPLESRYDVAVLWNAMARCRDIHQLEERDDVMPRLPVEKAFFASLDVESATDAWCGKASLKSTGDQGADSMAAGWPAHGMVAPYDDFKESLMAKYGDLRAGVVRWGLVYWLGVVGALLVFAMPLEAIERYDMNLHVASKSSVKKRKEEDEKEKEEEKTENVEKKEKVGKQENDGVTADTTLVESEPAWVRVQAQNE